MTPELGRPQRSWRAIVAALALTLTLPASSVGVSGYNTDSPPYVAFTASVPDGARFVPLIDSGEMAYGDTFEGIPDGIGVVPGPRRDHYVDLYVAHEQSRVPFGLTATTVWADYQDSSVTRVRVDTKTNAIIDMEVALPASAGFIRFCSAFMAGPQHGFENYTFLLNEESDDNLAVPAGAVYGSDPALAPLREAGYAVYLDTETGAYDAVPGMGRHNHENSVVVPGGWDDLVVLSGDDTFNPPSSQLYLYQANDAPDFLADRGSLYAFRVTATHLGEVAETDPFNNANDYLEISPGQSWSGEFILVPPDIAKGEDAVLHPQADLELWSNAANVFQFVRVEDMAYDPDNPRVVYVADTGSTRLKESGVTGRLFRAGSAPANRPWTDTDGRIFQMVLNAEDPLVVDSFSIFAENGLRVANPDLTTTVLAPTLMRSPDNLDVGKKSILVQEDASDAKIWRYSFDEETWTHVATATQAFAETSGVVDVSAWFGSGWWALDVQSHEINESFINVFHTWTTPPIPPGGDQYRFRRELGQLLLMFIPGS